VRVAPRKNSGAAMPDMTTNLTRGRIDQNEYDALPACGPTYRETFMSNLIIIVGGLLVFVVISYYLVKKAK